MKQRGAYHLGKKHGNWVEYSSPGILYTTGNYDMDKKTGVWSTSKENGAVLEKFDYTTHQKLVPEIHISLEYPPKARTSGVQGTVVLSFQVEADCTVTNLQVLQSLQPECDKEATQKLLKYYQFMKKYGPSNCCVPKSDTFTIHFNLD